MMPSRRLLLLLSSALLVVLAGGCEPQSNDPPTTGKPRPAADRMAAPGPGGGAAIPIELYDNYIETGDLDAVVKRGKLRLLVDPSRSAAIHRKTTQQDVELEQARLLARRLGIELVVLEVPTFADLIPMLEAGHGDLIANNLLITRERQQRVDFSLPTLETDILLVSTSDTAEVGGESDLSGRTLVVTAGTEFEQIARDFAGKYPGLQLAVREDNHIDLLVDVAIGRADFTIVDRQALQLVQQFREGLRANMKLSGDRPAAWALRQDSPRLLRAVNEQVRQLRRTGPPQLSRGDLDAIQQRGVLRAVTRNHPGTYFMWKGELRGFEYELLQNYARELGVRLDITVARSREEFVRLLREGEVDVCASLLPVGPRQRIEGIAFSDPYLRSRLGIVTRHGDGVNSRQELAGRTLCVRRATSYLELARQLQREVGNLELRQLPPELDLREVIQLVIEKECDASIADEVSVRLEQDRRDEIQFVLPLPDARKHYAWMVRESNPQLLRAINEFFAAPATHATIEKLSRRYFNTPHQRRDETRAANPPSASPR